MNEWNPDAFDRWLTTEPETTDGVFAESFPVVTICGSMRYFTRMIEVAGQLTRDQAIVLMPFVGDYVGGKDPDDVKHMLDEMHRVKIDMSEAIYVIGEHIGESTQSEIRYATETGKTICYITSMEGPI
jgi:hypothetical protein